MTNKPKNQSTMEQIEKMRKASSVKAPRDFATMRTTTSNKPAETLSQVTSEIKAHQKALPSLREADRLERINKLGTITKEADDAYKAAKALGGPKKLHVKGSGKFGALASLLGVGTSLLAPESKAAELLGKVGEAAEKVDPSTYLQEGLDDPRNSVEAIKAYAEKAKNKNKVPSLSEESISNVKGLLRGDEDASSLLGERPVPDMEDGERLYRYKREDELKKKLGYK